MIVALLHFYIKLSDVLHETLITALHICYICRPGMDEFCSVLEELVNNKDNKLSSRLETLVKFQYRRHIRNTTDPFKR